MNRFQLGQRVNIATPLVDLIHEYVAGPNEKKKEEDVHLGRWPHWVQYTVIMRDYIVNPDDMVDAMIQASVDENIEGDIYYEYGTNTLRELYDMYDIGFYLAEDGNGGYIWSE